MRWELNKRGFFSTALIHGLNFQMKIEVIFTVVHKTNENNSTQFFTILMIPLQIIMESFTTLKVGHF